MKEVGIMIDVKKRRAMHDKEKRVLGEEEMKNPQTIKMIPEKTRYNGRKQ